MPFEQCPQCGGSLLSKVLGNPHQTDSHRIREYRCPACRWGCSVEEPTSPLPAAQKAEPKRAANPALPDGKPPT